MAEYIPPKINTAFICYRGLTSQADATIYQASPTLAAGDFKVSIDGGALANLTTLPTVTPAAGKMIKISLSAAEMNGDNITVVASDAAGAEWMDEVWVFQTGARQIVDLAFPTTTGRSLDVTATGEAGIDWANIGAPTTTNNLSGTSTKAVEPTVAGRTLDVAATGEAGLDFANINIYAAGAFAPTDVIDSGTAQSATGTTLVLRAAAAFADSELVGCTVVIRSATAGAGQRRLVTASVGATDTITVDPAWTTTPTGTIVYDVFGSAPGSTTSPVPADLRQVNGTAIPTPAVAGVPIVDTKYVTGTVQTAGDLKGSIAVIQSDTDDIQTRIPAALTANGNIKSSLVEILTTALTETVGLTAAAFKKFFNVGTPTGTVNSIPDAVAGAASGLAIVGSNMGTATSVTGSVGSVTGAVGSVTGAVGSVTGAVGSVTGAVGSVTGAVGSVTAAVTLTAAYDASKTYGGVRKNIAQLLVFTMTDSTTHAPKIAVAVTATRSIDGAAYAACANAVTEISGGNYQITLAAADLNGDAIGVRFTGAASDDLNIYIKTQA